MSAIAKVEPLSTARALRGPFDYSLPAAFADVQVGSLLVVPFASRRMLGVVVELADRSALPPERLAAPLEALELGVPTELVSLALWLARETCSTPARALALMLPAGTGRGPRPRVRRRTALVARLREPAPTDDGPTPRLTSRQRETLARLAEAGPMPVTALAASHDTLRRLRDRGLVELRQESVERRPRRGQLPVSGTPTLTAHQHRALEPIRAAMRAGNHKRLLLHGVTGSGKTEVYLQAAAEALERERGAIVLVPEIALTPQIVARFQARFGDTVAVLHSRLRAGERHDEWLRLRRGDARVCVGPRSAVFAPVARLGLVVVDEEHDPSYKQESDPRYDARSVAARRAQAGHAVLVCGSATPRPESVHALSTVRLPERVDGRALPPVEVLDMRDRVGALHPTTRAALADVRRTQSKAIVLLNRRGWSNFLTCRGCGKAWCCPHCDVTLVLHRDGSIACHHCGHRQRAPSSCDACGSLAVARHGAGTERLEHELGEALGGEGFPVLRLDADVLASGATAVDDVLEHFSAADAGVLVGTQMVAKGHDFPDVTLGVILDADATLRFPDFRAEERTFSLVTQLAGRAGRGPAGGVVLVQTLAPDARAITHAARHDANGFIAGELERRAALRYPPFAELIRVVCASPAVGSAIAAAAAIAERLDSEAGALLGPAPLFRLRGRERAQLLIKAHDRDVAVRTLGEVVDAVARERTHRAVSIAVDVDPQ
ncbi:MAG: primosomal protein N' [Solirubrobacterales bacterium]|nr:MAG: primosomal protein N' [Solirubrobacterales bacterium]